ncbi:hypothetical protein F5X68DRAFT_245980 [Plectosphaerella plurivora]|uniref:Oxidase ustYa n=1 Tax=Plectosphaerella plurivora TaxID=936078 RepID=A0A9P9A773_9PEZI|nr:hypothetical protein F5X68DRAFT_245980 [Plectosphaerella plurivora]
MAEPTTYRSIATADVVDRDRDHDRDHDNDDSYSTTDVESILLETKEWHDEGDITGRSHQKTRSWWRQPRRMLDAIMIAVNVALTVVLLMQLRTMAPSQPPEPSCPQQVGGEPSGEDPPFDLKVIKWEADATFVPNNTVEFFEPLTVDRWKTLLPESAHRGDSETFSTTSMTHQLHCLFMMGRVYAGVTHDRTAELPHDYHAHFLHCIDYLRQGVMCTGDVALEPHMPSDSDDLGPKDGGWNGMHVCKDYSQVLQSLNEEIEEGVRTVLPIDD